MMVTSTWILDPMGDADVMSEIERRAAAVGRQGDEAAWVEEAGQALIDEIHAAVAAGRAIAGQPLASGHAGGVCSTAAISVPEAYRRLQRLI